MGTKRKKHGTVTGYTSQGCRCDRCRKAISAYMEGYKARLDPKDTPHATARGYAYFGCRCEWCSEARRVSTKFTNGMRQKEAEALRARYLASLERDAATVRGDV